MGAKTSAEIKRKLDDLLLEDTPDLAPWTVERKRRAINRAIRSTWPNFKIAKENASAVVLATGIYKYSLVDVRDIDDMGNGVGICQVLLEPRTQYQDWVPLRAVRQSQDGSTWYLHVPKRIADANRGRRLKLRYYTRLLEFTASQFSDGSGTLASEFANYVIYTAAVDLFGLYAQEGSDDNVEDMLKLIPFYAQRAQTEWKANTVYCMPILVGVRAQVSRLCTVVSS